MDNQSYSMGSRLIWADLGADAVTRELLSTYGNPNTGREWYIEKVFNVEKDPAYQSRDIDLVVQSRNVVDGTVRTGHIEIKCDSYPAGDLGGRSDQGNFFLEIVSNDTKKPRTPGCFLYCEADFLYYLFATTGTLYVMPMQQVRASFLKRFALDEERVFRNPSSLTEITTIPGFKHTTTRIQGRPVYRTWGVAVPIRQVLQWAMEDGWALQKRHMLPAVLDAARAQGVMPALEAQMPRLARAVPANVYPRPQMNITTI